ncbi:nectin-4-like isoform X4 [Salarias fasciatus]|uniref:nectin-4-like isoform X4 n=1 Tax=Salarias fasciatus TaxID=181472 RepID=UPI00117684F0|nr:nectin-4-like isoform X4 [Salarias fasciatus]
MDLFSHHIPRNRFAPSCNLLILMLVIFCSRNTQVGSEAQAQTTRENRWQVKKNGFIRRTKVSPEAESDQAGSEVSLGMFQSKVWIRVRRYLEQAGGRSGRRLRGVSVTGGDLTVVEGHDVTLPCKMTQEKRLTQISWKRKTRGMPGNPFFFTISEGNGQSFVDGPDPRISFIGHFAERNGTLQISNVSLNDEGSYTCIFSLFPSGIYSTEIPLGVEVPPATSLNSTLLVLGNEEVLLATCTAAASRPAAQLRWITGALEKNLRETTSVTEHVPPMNVTIVETSDDTLECVSEGNPEPSVRWTRSNKTLPESDFRVDGGKLTFLRCASDLKGFYQCEVSNPYGQQSQQVYWTVCSGSNPAPWILFGFSFFLNVIGAVWYWYKSGYITRSSGVLRVPTDSNSAEMVPGTGRGRDSSGSHENGPSVMSAAS